MSKEIEKFVFVTIESKEEFSDNIVAILSIFPILGIEEKNDIFVVHFKKEDWEKIDYKFFIDSLKIVDPSVNIISIDTIQDKNWNEEWEKIITPVIVTERISVVPSWKKGETGKEIELVIDPKMSFGTGHHATTKIVMTLAEKYVKRDSFWIDVGTGTGILAILAIKLGAKEVLAIDNNSWAIQNIYENLKNNNISSGIDIVELDIDTLPNLPIADGIFANLNYDVVVRNLKKFRSSVETTSGVVLVSGILLFDYDDFALEVERFGFDIIEVMRLEEWFGAVLKSSKV
ncbi:MAG: 50S ribosomal protein L11 methyltransferase [Ignavibacteria bacterium]|nr:50S ribosomal protein L11 methyltransferase [Ignavibacteria bacterium]